MRLETLPGIRLETVPCIRLKTLPGVRLEQYLVLPGIFLIDRDEDFSTALILGARHGHSSIVKLLLDNSVDVNQCDKVKVIRLKCVSLILSVSQFIHFCT